MQERTLTVSIPKGVMPGQQLRRAGQGHPGSGGAPSGGLYRERQLKPAPRYRRADTDLYTNHPRDPRATDRGPA